MEEEQNSRVTLKGTGKVDEDKKEEMDRQEKKRERGMRGVREKLMAKRKRKKKPLKRTEFG